LSKIVFLQYERPKGWNTFKLFGEEYTVAKQHMEEHEKENNDIKDDIIRDYNSIIRESALLTTVSGFLFGFLLNISLNTPKGFGPLDSIVLMISLFAITLAVSLFAMPVVYHHLQYPYRDLEKFKLRSHRFIKFGIVPAAITLYSWIGAGFKTWISVNEF
jgi:hypothetical protein